MRFEHLNVQADCYVGSRALPSLSNVALNIAESTLGLVGITWAKRTKLAILKDVSGIVKPSRSVRRDCSPTNTHIGISIICFIYIYIYFFFKFCRMALLLGPPSSGKTTLLLALAGKLDPNLKVMNDAPTTFSILS